MGSLCKMTLLAVALIVGFVVVIGTLVVIRMVKISSNTNTEAGQLIAAVNVSADPCTDFYQYACGDWIKGHSINAEAERGSETVHSQLKYLLEQHPDTTKVAEMAQQLYMSCVDEELRNSVGMQPLIKLINRLGPWPLTSSSGLPLPFDLEDTLGKLAGVAVFPLIEVSVTTDTKNSSSFILVVSSGMSEMVEYLRDDLNSSEVKNYKGYLLTRAVLSATGIHPADQDITDVLLFEEELLQLLPTTDGRVNPGSFYKNMNLSELQASSPKFNWTRFLTTFLGPRKATVKPSMQLLSASKPTYFKDVMALCERTNKRTVANYFLMKIVTTYEPYLPKDITTTNSSMSKRMTLSVPRWKTCVQEVIDNLPDGVGQLFAEKYFLPPAKRKALSLARYIQDSMKYVIQESKWMDGTTKVKAQEKLAAMKTRVGYPDYQFNNTFLEQVLYQGIRIDTGNYLQTILNLKERSVKEMIGRLDNKRKHVIPWKMSAAAANAFYSPTENTLYLLAAMLQPPVFANDFPVSEMFGSTGTVVGREIAQGFGAQGGWMEKDSLDTFNRLSKCFVDQVSKTGMAGGKLNGLRASLQSIADLGGLKAANMAYVQWQGTHGMDPLLPGLGLTNAQIFYLSTAQPLCGNIPDTALKHTRHIPNAVRVHMIVVNSYHFSDVFSCPVGAPMNPAHKYKMAFNVSYYDLLRKNIRHIYSNLPSNIRFRCDPTPGVTLNPHDGCLTACKKYIAPPKSVMPEKLYRRLWAYNPEFRSPMPRAPAFRCVSPAEAQVITDRVHNRVMRRDLCRQHAREENEQEQGDVTSRASSATPSSRLSGRSSSAAGSSRRPQRSRQRCVSADEMHALTERLLRPTTAFNIKCDLREGQNADPVEVVTYRTARRPRATPKTAFE